MMVRSTPFKDQFLFGYIKLLEEAVPDPDIVLDLEDTRFVEGIYLVKGDKCCAVGSDGQFMEIST
jgi:hypothetical protein